MKEKILVIGNGESRKNIDIDKFNFMKIGCNAIIRDYAVDILSCFDKKMLLECVKNTRANLIYTRSRYHHVTDDARIKFYPELPFDKTDRRNLESNWSSGTYALMIAGLSDASIINVIGFDLYTNNRKQNNIYKDTHNYAKSSDQGADPRYWMFQISKIMECFSEKQFVFYNNPEWHVPNIWKKHKNFKFDKIENLLYH